MTWPAFAGAAIGFGLVMVVLVLRQRFVVATVRGDSMLPTYRSGDRVLVRRRRLDQVRRGQVVVAAVPRAPTDRSPPLWVIKRVLALPGDEPPGPFLGSGPASGLLVVGDNPDASYDSRLFGQVAGADLLGTAVRNLTRCPADPQRRRNGPDSSRGSCQAAS